MRAQLGGAALDVFEHEPLAAGSPLAGCPNLMLTPHIAGRDARIERRVSAMIAAKVAALLDGRGDRACRRSPSPNCATSRGARSPAPAHPTAMARITADALVAAEAQGLSSHGIARVAQYATHLRNGRADGRAVAVIARERGGAILVDARSGLAFPACALAVDEAIRRARELRRCVRRRHEQPSFRRRGVAPAAGGARRGMVGLAFGNSPAAMPAAGGKRALFGTNPIAAVFPRRDGIPLSIDLSLSEAARGKVMVAAKEGRPIPLGWALDRDGQPTTDAKAALEGSMLAMGGTKGAMLALVVELLVTAFTGAAMGFEASSFFVDEGNRPRIGQAFLVIDPDALAGRDVYLERVETLVAAMLDRRRRPPSGARRASRAAVSARNRPHALADRLAPWPVT